MKQSNLAAILVAIVCLVSGLMGLFVRDLGDSGLNLASQDITFIRCFSALLIFAVFILIYDRSLFKTDWKAIPIFIVFAIIKTLSDVTLIYSQQNCSLALATMLQMMAPYFVFLFSYVLFRHRITLLKITVTCVAFIGCIMANGILFGNTNFHAGGVTSGILSGMFYGLFILSGKVSSDRGYNPFTTLFYLILFSTIIILPFVNLPASLSATFDPRYAVDVLGLGVLITLIPYAVMMWAASKIDVTVMSVVSVLELVGAAIVGVIFFGENIKLDSAIGYGLIIFAVMMTTNRIAHTINKYEKSHPGAFKILLKFGKDPEPPGDSE